MLSPQNTLWKSLKVSQSLRGNDSHTHTPIVNYMQRLVNYNGGACKLHVNSGVVVGTEKPVLYYVLQWFLLFYMSQTPPILHVTFLQRPPL